jgi:xanthine dehydrogenase accessory factor
MGDKNREWLPVLSNLCEQDVPCVLITVMEARGSTPREAGTKMVVTNDDQFGTIGGGNLEHEAIKQARELLDELAEAPEVRNYPLGPALAQCCGGSVDILLEPFIRTSRTLLLFGAGHVGKEVIKVMEGLPVDIKWVDERENEFPDDIPCNTTKIVTAAPVDELCDIDENSFVLVMTHSHDLDLELVKAAMDNGSFHYLGLIGSKTKKAKFEKRLKSYGIGDGLISRLTCPIGVGGITGKHPREIAVSVAAELLTLGLTHQVNENEAASIS